VGRRGGEEIGDFLQEEERGKEDLDPLVDRKREGSEIHYRGKEKKKKPLYFC